MIITWGEIYQIIVTQVWSYNHICNYSIASSLAQWFSDVRWGGGDNLEAKATSAESAPWGRINHAGVVGGGASLTLSFESDILSILKPESAYSAFNFKPCLF